MLVQATIHVRQSDQVANFEPAERPVQLERVFVPAVFTIPGQRFCQFYGPFFRIEIVGLRCTGLTKTIICNVICHSIADSFLLIPIGSVDKFYGELIIYFTAVFTLIGYQRPARLRNKVVCCEVIQDSPVWRPGVVCPVVQGDDFKSVVRPKDISIRQGRNFINDVPGTLRLRFIRRSRNEKVCGGAVFPVIVEPDDFHLTQPDFIQDIADIVGRINVDAITGI